MKAELCFGMATGTPLGKEGGEQSALPSCPVLQRAQQTFSFKVRTGLGQRREILSVLEPPSGGQDPVLSGSVTTSVSLL